MPAASAKVAASCRWPIHPGARIYQSWQVALPLRSESNLSTPKNTLPHPIFIKPMTLKNHQNIKQFHKKHLDKH
jgi:hypothetical protein